MRPLKTLPILGISLLLTSSAYATLVTQKVTLKGNMIVTYNQKPQIAKNFNELFTQGKFFGRLRLNSFYWDWDKNSAKLMDNKALGLGASLIYKTAKYKGLSGTLALYTSQNPSFFREEQEDVALVKAGKDTFSRYNTDATGRFGITTFAQAYLQYENNKISYILGRQLFESVFTKSNDTKMIPNSFMNEYGMNEYNAGVITSAVEMAHFFESMMEIEGVSAKTATSLLTVELLARLKGEMSIVNSPVDAQKLGKLAQRIDDKTISGKAAKDVLDYLIENDVDVDDVIEKLGLKQVTDMGAIEAMCDEIIDANPEKVEQYKGGKEKLFGFFVGQVMKASKGSANPQAVNEILKAKLG